MSHRNVPRTRTTARRALLGGAAVSLAIMGGVSYLGYQRGQEQELRARVEAEQRAREQEALERKAAEDEKVAELREKISREEDPAQRARLRAELEVILRSRTPDAGHGVRFVDRCMEGDPMCPFDL